LKDHGRSVQDDSGMPIIAVDIEIVRKVFIELSLAHGSCADERTIEKVKTFKKTARAAHERGHRGG
jgi:hypothetical protein